LNDAFKAWHKILAHSWYASDIDLVLVYINTKFDSLIPKGRILAIVDLKRYEEEITESEEVAYKDLIERGYEVYIARGFFKEKITSETKLSELNAPFKNMDIFKLELRNKELKEIPTGKKYIEWEREIRRDSYAQEADD